jgi:hypothetical protein
MDKHQLKGSQTAKNGFANEKEIISKFNLWQTDEEAKQWLCTMGYNLDEIELVNAVKVKGSFKADVQIQVSIKLKQVIDCQNLQVKLVSIDSGFNQIDKRWVDKYAEMWNVPNSITSILKRYCGEEKPTIQNPKDSRRMFANEFTQSEQKEMINWLNDNKILIITDIIKGRGQFAAEWILVAQKVAANSRWTLQPINICLNHYANGEAGISPRNNFFIARIGMQRKGGDGGRKTANMLQFKIDPTELFDL